MTRERPILFSAPMIKAILSGAKTQTRRAVTTRHPLKFLGGRGEEDDPEKWGWFFDGPHHHGYMVLGRGLNERFDGGCTSIPCPYGVAGDRLWCKETWGMKAHHDDVRVQRLQEISEDDDRAEGCRGARGAVGQMVPGPPATAVEDFERLWDSINGKPSPMLDDDSDPVLDDDGRPRKVASRSWASNPWVWAITFRRMP